MAKKPGLMNDPKHVGGGNGMLGVANIMAKAAHLKSQKAGKSYLDPDGDDSDNSDSQEENALPGSASNPSKDGAKHPSAPKSVASQYDGEQHAENQDGAVHPSAPKSKREIAAIKAKSKGLE